MEENKNKEEMGEDTTKYGEFVCSAFHWLHPKDQRKQVKKLENITNKENERKN